ncbi:MAG: UTP--glucose-1-phosphate uridylyltransferase GalU [Chloroflexi bacterium]|nr:UTP--glucose-1-phosphate uridylyltransferase GalU [Chloroflexota bacterium]
MPVRTAVIPAAGLGTRFLPATKAIPKEMLPLIDRPSIQYVVEEAAEAGIQRIVLVTSRGKSTMEDHFDLAPELEAALEAKSDTRSLELVRRPAQLAEIISVRQKRQLGLGHAVLTARQAVGREPFIVYLPDDIIRHPVSATHQMLSVFERYKASVVAVEDVPRERVSSYGVIQGEQVEERLWHVRGMVEKPAPDQAPSTLGIVGRYVLTPEVFDALEKVRPGAIGEIQLTDAIALLARSQPVYAYQFQGRRYDVGTPQGMLRASVEMALEREDMAPALVPWLKALARRLEG